jgi:predicted metal-dependent hydrolase
MREDGRSVGSGTILQGGRKKAYRPLPVAERRAALEAGLAAHDRGDWFLAHELLEPAWMGTADLPERALYQALIKLAAGHVHLVRRNAAGVTKNLTGAKAHLLAARDGGVDDAGIDLPALLDAIDDRLERLRALDDAHVESMEPVGIPWRA